MTSPPFLAATARMYSCTRSCQVKEVNQSAIRRGDERSRNKPGRHLRPVQLMYGHHQDPILVLLARYSAELPMPCPNPLRRPIGVPRVTCRSGHVDVENCTGFEGRHGRQHHRTPIIDHRKSTIDILASLLVSAPVATITAPKHSVPPPLPHVTSTFTSTSTHQLTSGFGTP